MHNIKCRVWYQNPRLAVKDARGAAAPAATEAESPQTAAQRQAIPNAALIPDLIFVFPL